MVNYLSHHGVEGQQWGVRNGPPYPLDSGKSGSVNKKHPLTPKADIGHKPSKKELAKYARSLSDEELKAANNRLVAEQNYIKNIHSPTNKEKVAKFLKEQGQKTMNEVVDAIRKEATKKLAQSIIDSVSKKKDD